MNTQEIMKTRETMASLGISEPDADAIIASAGSMNHMLDDASITDYHDILTHYGRRTMTLAMVMERYYHTDRSWIMDHIDDANNKVSLDNDQCISIIVSGMHSVMKFDGAHYITIHMMMKHIQAIAIGDDLYDVINAMGWVRLYALYANMTDFFPYKEYKTSRKTLYGIIHDVMHDAERLDWVLSLISWIIEKRPFFSDKVDGDWVMARVDYPIEFLKESYDFSDEISYDDYVSEVESSIASLRTRISMMGMSPDESDNCASCMASMKSLMTDGISHGSKSRLVNASNLGRWMVYAKRIRNIPDSFLDIMKTVDDIGELGVWDIYTFISRGAQHRGRRWNSLPYSNIGMEQAFSATNEYLDISTRNVDAMRRWAAWIRVQHEFYKYDELLVVNDSEHLAMMQFNPAKLYRVPLEMRAWILHGIIPDTITYGTVASLTVPEYAKDILKAYQ